MMTYSSLRDMVFNEFIKIFIEQDPLSIISGREIQSRFAQWGADNKVPRIFIDDRNALLGRYLKKTFPLVSRAQLRVGGIRNNHYIGIRIKDDSEINIPESYPWFAEFRPEWSANGRFIG